MAANQRVPRRRSALYAGKSRHEMPVVTPSRQIPLSPEQPPFRHPAERGFSFAGMNAIRCMRNHPPSQGDETMVATLTKKHVDEIVRNAGLVMPRKPTVAVLGHVLLQSSEDGAIQATATDLEQTLTMRIMPEELQGAPGRFLFPVGELKTLAKSMPKGGTVTFQPVSEESVVCTVEANGQPVSRTVPTMPVAEFPEVSVQTDELTDCDLGAFLRAYRQAAFAASSDPGRLVLNAVLADQANSVLVATDGHRLTQCALPAFPFPTDAILPLNKVLLKHFPEADQGRIGLREQDGVQTLVLATDELTYSCRCIEGRFPDYRQVIPAMDGFATTLQFGPADVESVRSLAPFLDKEQDHMLCLFGKHGRALLAMENGTDATILPLAECRFEGGETGLCINGKLLLEALEHGFLSMRVRNGQTPLVFEDGRDGLHLLMPLRQEPSEALRAAAEAHLGKAAEPDAADTPIDAAPTTTQETAPMPDAESTTPSAQQPVATPAVRNLHLVGGEAEDPVARLEQLVEETQELVKQANASMREVRKQLRVVKTHFRTRGKEIESREREMEKSRGLIQRLQEAIAA
jgi:DNA polymerase-3 subunit beta